MSKFLPANSLSTPRFCGAPTFMRLQQTKQLDEVDIAVIGIPLDSASPFRTGSRFGPNAIRNMSIILRPINPYRQKINIFETHRIIDFGDVAIIPGYVEESFTIIENEVKDMMNHGVTPIALGGDHSITLPVLRAAVKKFKEITLLHFDSHVDTWNTYFGDKKYSGGTTFRRAAEEKLIVPQFSIQVGLRGSLFGPNDLQDSTNLGFEVITTDEVFSEGIRATAEKINHKLKGKKVFISFDMDFVDPVFAPGVQIPEAGGPTSRETLELIRRLKNLDVIGCDIVEVAPMYDDHAQNTCLLAATIASELIALITESS